MAFLMERTPSTGGNWEKLRLETDLNEVVIGHWKSHDDQEEYYSKVRTIL